MSDAATPARPDSSLAPGTPLMPAVIVGAYASLPAERGGRAEYYERLAMLPGVCGLEIPFRDDLWGPDGLETFAADLRGRFTRNIVTAIPGTMMRVWDSPTFGLASTDPEGRRTAIAFTRRIFDEIQALHDAVGTACIAALELHSAPSGPGGQAHNGEAFAASLQEIATWDWGSTQLLVEHCDAFVAPDQGEKRFMTLEEEIGMLWALGLPNVQMSLNWGRSALEARDSDEPARHVKAVREAGLLAGITFSGAGPQDTQCAKAWMDGHLPLDADEPGSVMGAQEVATCTDLALEPSTDTLGEEIPPAWYIGVKCQVPGDADIPTRLSYINHILQATGLASHGVE